MVSNGYTNTSNPCCARPLQAGARRLEGLGHVVVLHECRQVHAAPELGTQQPVPLGEHHGAAQERGRLEQTAGGSQGPSLACQQLRDHLAEVHALGDHERLVENRRSLRRLGREQVGPSQLREQADAIRVLGDEPAQRGPDLGQERKRLERTPFVEERAGHVGCGTRLEPAVAVPSSDGEQVGPLREDRGRVTGQRELGHAQAAQAEPLVLSAASSAAWAR